MRNLREAQYQGLEVGKGAEVEAGQLLKAWTGRIPHSNSSRSHGGGGSQERRDLK